jgi:hypothetical protein
VATKALACKLCKAVWHVWNDQTEYDPVRVVSDGLKTV